MHRLLEEQIKKYFGSLEAIPSDLKDLLEEVSHTYAEADSELEKVQSMQGKTLEEIAEINRQLRRDLEYRGIIEEALKNSEERAKVLLESSPLPIIIYDELDNVEFINIAFERKFGWIDEEVLGRPLEFVPPEHSPESISLIKEKLKNKSFQPFESKRLTKDKKLVDVEINAASLKDTKGVLIGTIVILRDITEENIAKAELEKRNQILETLNQVARETTLSFEVGPVFDQIVRVAGEAVNATSAYLIDWNETEKTSTVLAEYYSPFTNELERVSDLGVSYRLTNEEIEEDQEWIRNPQAYYIARIDDPDLDKWDREDMLKYGGKTKLIVPLIKHGGAPFGLLEIWDSRELRDFTSSEIELVKTIAGQVSTTLENANLYKSLQSNEERLRKFFENTNDAILIIDIENDRVIDANPKASDMLGYNLERLLLMNVSAVYPGEMESLKVFGNQVLRNGSGWTDEINCTTNMGKVIPTEISASLIEMDGRQYILAVIRDISDRKKHEQELEEQKRFLAQVIDTNPSLVFAKDRKGRYTLVNKAMADAYHASVDMVLGKSDADFSGDLAALREFEVQDKTVFETGKQVYDPGEFKRTRDGSRRWRETIKRPLFDKDGNIIQVLGVVNDITDHKMAEEALMQQNKILEILNQISREASLTLSLEEILETAAELIGETIDVTSIYINSWDPSTRLIRVLAEYISPNAAIFESEPSVGNIYNLQEEFEDTAKWLDENPTEPLISHVDDQGLSPQERAYKVSNNVKSSLCLAIFHDNKPFAYFELYESRQKRTFEQSEIEFLQTVGYQIASAINNAQLYRALKESEQRFQSLLENSSDLISILDGEGNVLYHSPSLERILGYRVPDRLGENVFTGIHPDDIATVKSVINKALSSPGENQHVEFRNRHLDGSWRYLESVGRSVVGEDGKPNIYLVTRDITERKQEERERLETFQRRGTQVQAANLIAKEITSASSVSDLYRTVVTLVKSKFDFYHVQYFQYNPASDMLVLRYGSGEIGAKMVEEDHAISMNIGPVGKAAGHLSAVLISDTEAEAIWQPNAYLPDTKSEIAIPITIGNTLLGVLDVQSNEPNTIDYDIQLVLEVLSGQIAIAIESIRLRTEMEERLREISTLQQITSSEGWQNYFDSISSPKGKGYRFDDSSAKTVEYQNEEPLDSEIIRAKGRSLVKPLSVRGERIGAIGIEEDDDRPLTKEEQDLLDSISEEVSEALEKARLFEASQRSAAELAVLNEMGNAFTESLNEHSIVENIYVYASRLLDLHEFYVALYDEKEKVISFPLAIKNGERITENHPDWPNWQPRPLDSGGLTGHIIKTREPVLIENNATEVLDSLGIPYKAHGGLTQSWLGVPINLGDRILGMISAQSDQVAGLYNQHHVELLNAIASQASIAIDNARLFRVEQSRAEQERLVRTITDKVRRGSDAKQIMRIALEELSQVLGADKSVIQLGTRDELLSKEVQEDISEQENGNAQR